MKSSTVTGEEHRKMTGCGNTQVAETSLTNAEVRVSFSAL